MNNLEQNPQSCQTVVMRCGLSEAEFTERELLLELQRNSQRWFSQQEFDRLKELSNKMFANAGSPHIGTCVYAVQVQRLINGYNFQSMAYTQCYAAKRTVKNYVGIY